MTFSLDFLMNRVQNQDDKWRSAADVTDQIANTYFPHISFPILNTPPIAPKHITCVFRAAGRKHLLRRYRLGIVHIALRYRYG